jgi:CrcB protein
VLGAEARYALARAIPPAGGFPWATFLANVSGCLLIGVLVVLVAGRHALLRPFLGVGVLGGYTTFSTYELELHRLIAAGAPGLALLYLAGTLLAALAATYAGLTVARTAVQRP